MPQCRSCGFEMHPRMSYCPQCWTWVTPRSEPLPPDEWERMRTEQHVTCAPRTTEYRTPGCKDCGLTMDHYVCPHYGTEGCSHSTRNVSRPTRLQLLLLGD